jgi:thioredoxin-related protein
MKNWYLLLCLGLVMSACQYEVNNQAPDAAAVNQAPQAVPQQQAPPTKKVAAPGEEIEWMTFEAAVSANSVAPRKIFVDVYTDWCGWCKVMDKQTFTDPEVIAYMNEHYYAVKFNAEQKEPVTVNGRVYEYLPNVGRRGVHTLAYSLLQGRMSYPSVVYMNENLQLIKVSPGYKKPHQILPELKAAVGEQVMDGQVR